MSSVPEKRVASTGHLRSVLARAIKLALIVLLLATGAVMIVAYMSGEQVELPFDYEGFD